MYIIAFLFGNCSSLFVIVKAPSDGLRIKFLFNQKGIKKVQA